MSEANKNWYSGKVCFFNSTKVDYHAEIYFDEYHQGIITIYGVTREDFLDAKSGKYKSVVILLEDKKYISAFDLYIKEIISNTKMVDERPEYDGGKIIFISSTILKGKNYFEDEETCKELIVEITDGCELIGLCSYDLNKNYKDIVRYKNIEIPIQISPIHINTIIGKLWISVFPEYRQSKDSFVIGFSHMIQFEPVRELKIKEIRKVLAKLTSFFSLLCGETVTINKLSVMKTTDSEEMDFIGICNFTKEKLDVLNNLGRDTIAFKRVSIFKLSDFGDLEKAMNYWFEHYEQLFNAQKAYDRILLDEELKIVTVGKFLAAMQLVEGYTQAFADEEKDIIDFENRKHKILSLLTEAEDIELIENGLGFSGISFRKALKEYLYKGSNCLNKITKTAFFNKHKELIDKIVNDRNFYTHSSNRIVPQMKFDEMLDVTTICKEIYRILIFNEMGISHSLLMQRFSHNRRSKKIFSNILEIKLCEEGELPQNDNAMWHFSDWKS